MQCIKHHKPITQGEWTCAIQRSELKPSFQSNCKKYKLQIKVIWNKKGQKLTPKNETKMNTIKKSKLEEKPFTCRTSVNCKEHKSNYTWMMEPQIFMSTFFSNYSHLKKNPSEYSLQNSAFGSEKAHEKLVQTQNYT